MKKAGKTNDAAILQAKANKLSLEESILSIQQEIHEMENSISVLVALPPQSIERDRLDAQVFPDSISAGVPLQLLSNRPDVRQAELKLEKAFYATNGARSAFYPQITLSGSAGWTNSNGGLISNPGDWLLNAVGSLVQPLFNKGRNIANLKVAKTEQEAASLSFQQTLLNAGKEVNDALTLWQTAQNKLKIDDEKIGHLEEAVHKTRLLMQYSSVNYLEVLTAEQSLLAAQMQQTQNRFDEIYGVVNLYHSIGGGVH